MDITSVVGEILEHHGVKGQKWGLRNKRSETAVTKSGARTHDPKNLSNQDLKKIIARMELETKYRDLNKKSTGEGKKFANDLMKNAGKTAFGVVVSAVTAKLVKDILQNSGHKTVMAGGHAAVRRVGPHVTSGTGRAAIQVLKRM